MPATTAPRRTAAKPKSAPGVARRTRQSAAGARRTREATLWQPSPALERARPGLRLSAFLALYLVLTLVIGARLIQVQVVDAGSYRALGERQTQRDIEIAGRRGRLYDRGGEPLALSLAAATVYAHPRLLAQGGLDPATVAAQLSPVIGRPEEQLIEALTRDVSFTYLARQLPRSIGEQVTAMRLPAVGVLEEARREYPAGRLAAQVIGFTGVDNVGLSGLELQYHELLAGAPGRIRFEQAPGGIAIASAPREVEPGVSGTDLVLTLDRQIQHHAEEVLEAAVERFGAKGASAVVLDSRSGEVLAMASAPGFAANDTGAVDPYARRNRAVTDIFEPGSVNKVITAAAALESGVVQRSEIFVVPYEFEVGGKVFRDLERRPTAHWNVADIMATSSNVGTILMAERVGGPRLEEYLRRFGYGEPTGVAFPGESAGLVLPAERYSATSLPTVAIGHGVSGTLLQVAGVFQTVANGGERTQPSIIRGTVGPDGKFVPAPPATARQVVSRDTAQTLSRMLTGVVEAGTGQLAAVQGYSVAGKTGTAQKPSETSRGYDDGKYIGTFAGFAPVENPAVIVAVMIDEASPIYYGGQTAAPIFSEIMSFVLHHRRVPPDAAG